MVSGIYKKSFSALKKQPFRLWGIALLGAFLYLAACIGFIAVPAAAFCVNLLLSASLAMIFLNSYRTGLEPKTAYLFAAFRKDRIWRVLGGMAWMQLWIFLWSLIPIAGIVFGVIRAYEYAFVPYILMTREDVKPTEAIKISKQETMGYKGRMFGADMLLFAIGFGVTLVLALLFFAAGLLATGLFAAARRVEEEVEEVAASEEVVSKGVVAALLARGGIAFYGDNAVDR